MSPVVSRRGFLQGVTATFLVGASPAFGAVKPTVLIFTSDSSERSQTVVGAFKEAMDFVIRISYDLGGQPDSGAFIADNTQGMQTSLVLSVGDLALKAAAREFNGIPLIYTDVRDDAPARGRSDVVGVSSRVDPGASLDQLQIINPTLKRLGIIRSVGDKDPYWAALTAACEARSLTLMEIKVASSGDVDNALASLVHQSDMLLLQPDPQIWTGATLASTLRGARDGGLQVVSWSRLHLEGPQPASMALIADAASEGRAAARLAAQLLQHTAVPPALYPPPLLIGNLAAMRAVGMKITKKKSKAVSEWVTSRGATKR